MDCLLTTLIIIIINAFSTIAQCAFYWSPNTIQYNMLHCIHNTITQYILKMFIVQFRCLHKLLLFRCFRVLPETNVYTLREEIEGQLGQDALPRDYVFLKVVGRHLTRVSKSIGEFCFSEVFFFLEFTCKNE